MLRIKVELEKTMKELHAKFEVKKWDRKGYDEFQVNGIIILAPLNIGRLCMLYRENTVCISLDLNGPKIHAIYFAEF